MHGCIDRYIDVAPHIDEVSGETPRAVKCGLGRLIDLREKARHCKEGFRCASRAGWVWRLVYRDLGHVTVTRV